VVLCSAKDYLIETIIGSSQKGGAALLYAPFGIVISFSRRTQKNNVKKEHEIELEFGLPDNPILVLGSVYEMNLF